ncbi:MAG TPA: hypothetical protein VJX93_04295 [Candidatus Methanomethylophilaceae archaeon]|nr:hypothetical protein [Candidatus Methanomethylophilaceae archaeon]
MKTVAKNTSRKMTDRWDIPYCTNCGYDIPKDVSNCPSCGVDDELTPQA